MNIGIFTDTYFPQINGVATSTMTLAQELRKLGHNVYIFTPSDQGVDKNEKYVYRLPSMRFVFSKNHRMTLVYPPKLLLQFRKLNLDVIHTQTEFSIGFLGSLVSDFYSIPLIHTYHTMYEDYVHYILNGHLITKKGAKRFSKIFCNGATSIIAPVMKTKEALVEYGVKPEIKVIPTGLYLDRYFEEMDNSERFEMKKALGISLDKTVCLVLGRLAKEKSVDVVIQQFPKVLEQKKDVILLIVGGGPYLSTLKTLVKTLDIEDKVIFTDLIPNNLIHKYYKLGDLFITASTSETQGLTYIEAMASKLPIIAKKDDSIKDVLTHNKNAYIFNKDSQLPELIIALINNDSLKESFIDKSLDIVKEYNANNFALEVLDVYESAILKYEDKKVRTFVKKTRGKISGKIKNI